MSPLWISALCLALAASHVCCDDNGEYGLKVEYDPTLFNGTDVLMEDRNIASDWILRELLPPELDAEDLELELQLQEENIADACPPGPKGLLCRRRFALRGADECAGGRCVMCRRCDLLTPVSWPICCKNHFLCCRPIARACQSCNVTELVSFCQDKFGRC
ncbi:uncharacterized protein LOC122388659 [Amphibalanus amphitrite]|uniref:uncharacterized protein LOC122388659 n=1 Tax=Amphibalanus amphitrite TaxID=1232801 RepID=UPI001C91D932|nr:uncharacterized protein LOC122388659 [Amphibalanus amphitrite]